MSALLVLTEAVRAAILGLRALASSLEAALNNLEAAQASNSSDLPLDLEARSSSWDLLSAPSAQAQPPATPPRLPRRDVPPSPAATDYSTNRYHEVASELTQAPQYCLDLCSSLRCDPAEVKARAQRAWEAGLWAKACLEGRVSKPRPTPKIALRAVVYIILKAPGLLRPTRVSSSAEYFRIIPSFKDSSSLSHSFPSLAEAKVYCSAVGIALPAEQ